ncbi:MAG TPA: aldo/keto reductase, partial [Mobilitalea sp.]|nr:aldo/keto reductase [Mobilitalea sp.]
MELVTLGTTGITVNKNGFGALPIQRISKDLTAILLKKAYNNGITFFDTARFYTDSEEKIGYALADVRDKIYIASKSMCKTVEEFWKQLKESLLCLQTEYIDIFQFHNPDFCPKPGDGTGLYEAMLEAKERGMIRHIGITNHRLKIALEAAESGLYETIQFPFSYLATDKEVALVELCKERNIGFIAMKALSGGLITNSAAAYGYLAKFPNVLPIWGIQKEKELDEFISYIDNPPVMKDELAAIIEKDRAELAGNFCRGCGYCMPCPAQIDIPTSARMSLMIRRAPVSIYLSEEWQEKMKRIDSCIH